MGQGGGKQPARLHAHAITNGAPSAMKKPILNPYYRVLINECFSQAHADLSSRILHRCAQQRADMRDFLEGLGCGGKMQMRHSLQSYLEEVVSHLDDEEAVKGISRQYGRDQVMLRAVGYKPDFFAAIADSIATECVFIGGQVTAASPTNTFKAWTVFVGVMFSSVRDGYYDELRRTRRQSPGGLESQKRLESCKDSSLDSTSSSYCADRGSPSACSSSRSPCTSSPRPSASLPLHPSETLVAESASLSATEARRVYRGSKTTAIATVNSEAQCTRSCDAISETKSSPRRDYRLPKQHHSYDLLSINIRTGGSVNSTGSGRFTKNVSLDYDSRRRQRLDEIGRKHASAYPSQSRQSSSSSCIFDPNRIMDAFMNDHPL